MGESGARCSKESWSNNLDKRERRGDLDTTFDEIESLHQLSEAELHNEEGSLPSTIYRLDLGPTGKIKLLLLHGWIFGLQPNCDPSR